MQRHNYGYGMMIRTVPSQAYINMANWQYWPAAAANYFNYIQRPATFRAYCAVCASFGLATSPLPLQTRHYLHHRGGGNAVISSSAPNYIINRRPAVKVIDRVSVVKNHVNVHKGSLTLEEDEENPGFYLLGFCFDANYSGKFYIFDSINKATKDGINHFSSKEPINNRINMYNEVAFHKGPCQRFKQDMGQGLCIIQHNKAENPILSIIVVIKAEINMQEIEREINDTTDFVASSQVTEVEVVAEKSKNNKLNLKTNNNYDANFLVQIRAIRQIVHVNDNKCRDVGSKDYEMQKIYYAGINYINEEAKSSNTDDESRCVICLSKAPTTLLLPCRHMCMCNGCVTTTFLHHKMGVLTCPLCRGDVVSLLNMQKYKTHIHNHVP